MVLAIRRVGKAGDQADADQAGAIPLQVDTSSGIFRAFFGRFLIFFFRRDQAIGRKWR